MSAMFGLPQPGLQRRATNTPLSAMGTMAPGAGIADRTSQQQLAAMNKPTAPASPMGGGNAAGTLPAGSPPTAPGQPPMQHSQPPSSAPASSAGRDAITAALMQQSAQNLQQGGNQVGGPAGAGMSMAGGMTNGMSLASMMTGKSPGDMLNNMVAGGVEPTVTTSSMSQTLPGGAMVGSGGMDALAGGGAMMGSGGMDALAGGGAMMGSGGMDALAGGAGADMLGTGAMEVAPAIPQMLEGGAAAEGMAGMGGEAAAGMSLGPWGMAGLAALMAAKQFGVF